ncbi:MULTISPECIES: DUF3574 domain-containing protein [Priestia]|nr:DUF3574 domain-containing protein [Priestia megaterium]
MIKLKNKLVIKLLVFLMLIGLFGYIVYAEHPSKQTSTTPDQQSNVLRGQSYLDDVVKIYVPSTYNIDQPIDNSKYVDQSLEKFSDMFGGATSDDGTGAWIGDNKKLVKEKVTIVYSFTEKLDKNKINEVVAYAKDLRKEMKQSSISIEVNGRMYFIE